MEETREVSIEEDLIPRGVVPWQVPLTPRNPGQGDITAAEVQAAYESAFNIQGDDWLHKLLRPFLFIRTPFYFADQNYKPVEDELLLMILDADTGDKEEYEAEYYDCDDFAFRLMGWFHMDQDAAAWPIFVTWINTPQGGHAVLSYYKDGQVFIIEPQTDQVFSVPDGWSLILLCG